LRKKINPIASSNLIQFAPNLPKSHSGKIMRRIVCNIAEDEYSNLGETSTLADRAMVRDQATNGQQTGNKRQGRSVAPRRVSAQKRGGPGDNFSRIP
jgi:hypothetical protein